MNIAEELDKLAGEGRISSVQLIRTNRGWQVYVNMPGVGSQVARSAVMPAAALQAALETLPGCEEYDRKYGAPAVTARAREAYDQAVDQVNKATDREIASAGVFD